MSHSLDVRLILFESDGVCSFITSNCAADLSAHRHISFTVLFGLLARELWDTSKALTKRSRS